MFVIIGAKSLFVFLLLRILAVGISFGPSVNASAVLTATRPILNSLATIPTSCNDTCNAIQATISDCTTAQCVCTSSNEASLNTCVNCLDAVEPNNQTNIAQGENILEQFAALCDSGGVSVPLETASGFTGSVVLPSTAPVGSGTASVGLPGTTSAGSPSAASGSQSANTGTASGAASPSTSTQTSGTSISVSSSTLSSSLSSTATSGASTSTANSTASTVSSSGASSTTAASSGAKRMFGESTTIALGGSMLFSVVLLWI